MNLNVVGGTLGAFALVSILVVHGCVEHRAPKVKLVPVPQIHVVKPAPAPIPVPVAPKPKAAPSVEYRRVVKGGKLGGTVTCQTVRDFTAGKSKAELEALAKEYGVTEAQLEKYKRCVK